MSPLFANPMQALADFFLGRTGAGFNPKVRGQLEVKFKAIIPRKFDREAFEAEVLRTQNAMAETLADALEKTVATWAHRSQVSFHVTAPRSPQVWRLQAEVTDTKANVWNLLNQGIDPHLISAALGQGAKQASGNRYQMLAGRGHTLAYQARYKPKTRPKVPGSQQGGKSGPWVFRHEVWHPGVEPRRFFEAVLVGGRYPFGWRYRREMKAAFERGAKASGHLMTSK